MSKKEITKNEHISRESSSRDSSTQQLIENTKKEFIDKYFHPKEEISKNENKKTDISWTPKNLANNKSKHYEIKEILDQAFTNDRKIQEAIDICSNEESQKLFKKHEEYFKEIFEEIFELGHHPSINIAAWHDSVHNAFDSYETLGYIKWINNIIEEYTSYLGSILHDIWRATEIELQGVQWYLDEHAKYSVWYLITLVKQKSQEFEEKNKNIMEEDELKKFDTLAKAIFARAINAVIVHPRFNDTRDPVFHHVQSLDRLAGISWYRYFVRLLFTVWLHWAWHDGDKHFWQKNIFPNGDRSHKLANVFHKDSDYAVMDKLETFTRGTFHKPVTLSMSHGEGQMDEHIRKSICLMTLIAWWPGTKEYNDTFYPELHPDEYPEWFDKKSKWILPEKFQEMIKNVKMFSQAELDAMQEDPMDDYSLNDLFEVLLAQQAMFLSENDKKLFFEYISNQRKQKDFSEENLKNTLKYIIHSREIDRKQELWVIHNNVENQDWYKAKIANYLKNYPLWSRSLGKVKKEIDNETI